VTPILDSGGVSALATQQARLAKMRRLGEWPPQVPAVVLAEALTSNHRRDFHRNKLLRMCQVRPVTEIHARTAARLRGNLTRPGSVCATDAVVAAFATTVPDAVVLTSDPKDLRALLEGTAVSVAAV
jgi:predicted nucleic acid-binding protein